jgi:hypothetical protein
VGSNPTPSAFVMSQDIDDTAVTLAGWDPPVQGARVVVVDAGHDELLRAPQVLGLVADLLQGEHPW